MIRVFEAQRDSIYKRRAEVGMTLEMDHTIASELENETKMPVMTSKVACYWLPSGKCMLSPPGKRTSSKVACYWLPSGKCMLSPPGKRTTAQSDV